VEVKSGVGLPFSVPSRVYSLVLLSFVLVKKLAVKRLSPVAILRKVSVVGSNVSALISSSDPLIQ
jgi:hypothetical protein